MAHPQQESDTASGTARWPFERWSGPLLVGLAFVLAALPPLHEMDLAQHLATGEWIVRNRAVPFTEPFAWTREGQPYFAYSWLLQVTYFLLLDTLGPIALHLLQGGLAATAVGATLWAGRAIGWNHSVRLAVAALHLALFWGVANILRPQQVLFTVVPLAWGIAAAIQRSGPSPARLVALTAVAALAANSHLFFPATAIPVAFYALTDARPRRWLYAGAAVLLGWLLTPYAFAWHRVFALNFGHNILLGRPPAVAEFVPGFEYAMHRPGVILAVLALLVAPWLLKLTTRERAVCALFWTVGLGMFAFAGRLVFFWWSLAFPMVGAAATLAATQRAAYARWSAVAIVAYVLLATAPPVSPVFWLFEGDTRDRMLPRAGEDPALWLPGWLLCNTREGATGRIFTEFNYGSELTWRLPGYSPSIDGRTIFPDRDAIEFSFYPYGRRRVHAETWREADLALLDRSFWLAPVLDADTAWVLLAQGRRTSRNTWGALWAKRSWWQQHGTADSIPAVEIYPTDPRGSCEKTGEIGRGR